MAALRARRRPAARAEGCCAGPRHRRLAHRAPRGDSPGRRRPPAGSQPGVGIVSDAVYAGSALRMHVALPTWPASLASVPSGTQVPLGARVSLNVGRRAGALCRRRAPHRIRARPGLRTALSAAVPVGFVPPAPPGPLPPGPLLLAPQGRSDYPCGPGRTAGSSGTITIRWEIALRVTLFSRPLAYPLACRSAGVQGDPPQRSSLYMARDHPLWVGARRGLRLEHTTPGPVGILNGLLQSGVIDAAAHVPACTVVALTDIYVLFTLTPIYAVLEAIPPALKEASQGASRWPVADLSPNRAALPPGVWWAPRSRSRQQGDFLAPQLLGGN